MSNQSEDRNPQFSAAAEEVQKRPLNDFQELSDEELEAVAGGSSIGNFFRKTFQLGPDDDSSRASNPSASNPSPSSSNVGPPLWSPTAYPNGYSFGNGKWANNGEVTPYS